MKAAVIAGSHRRQSETARVAQYIADRCVALAGRAPFVLDLGQTTLPFWDESLNSLEGSWGPIAEELRSSDALVVVTPEWGGMVPSALKNFFLLCDRGEIAHKPACLVGVSASSGGAYPLAELRMSSYKNTHVCYIPEQIIVRHVEEVLGTCGAVSEIDQSLRARIDYTLGLLVVYAAAFREVRTSGRVDLERYPYGM
ncbi:NADPH azoreductase [Burkholderia pseudomallei]|uniref:NADPH-dependent FMN reductase n=1 Tax=Burkholderia pseudomallei TaxID=28450 RepID=UPI000F05C21B|nr:NAD(P)H-dependent oxidoreductase [Burkholderia pseudomallei]VBY40156.1 NADPH azoreductase [Burkholderia pseudomallei]VBY63057.1 NADPH azoreductase [Burkholderia pseudomallei]VBY77250.1 NADPH azoreductase [Burkholderia pseudomallei]VBY88189.1 NADPH azoreductase [Burkholderia pseudomallei]